MILDGQGGKVNVQQAKKWLNVARKSGHAGAMAVFGNLIFQEGQSVRGLAFLTAALEKCHPNDCAWMQALQEEAFSIANEEDRRVAVAWRRRSSISRSNRLRPPRSLRQLAEGESRGDGHVIGRLFQLLTCFSICAETSLSLASGDSIR